MRRVSKLIYHSLNKNISISSGNNWNRQVFLNVYQYLTYSKRLVGWLFGLRINVDLAIVQPYIDLEAGDNQSLKIQAAKLGIEPRSSCSSSQELNHSATATPYSKRIYMHNKT